MNVLKYFDCPYEIYFLSLIDDVDLPISEVALVNAI